MTVEIRRDKEIYGTDGGWFQARWHFSFDHYYDPRQMGVGALRVFNDDRLQPGAVWPMHPHADIESCTLSVSGVARQWDLLVLRCRLGVVDRAGVKVERPERHEDDDLDAGEGHHRMKERRGLGSPSGITSRCGLKLNWRAGIVARGRPALSRCSDLVRRHDG